MKPIEKLSKENTHNMVITLLIFVYVITLVLRSSKGRNTSHRGQLKKPPDYNNIRQLKAIQAQEARLQEQYIKELNRKAREEEKQAAQTEKARRKRQQAQADLIHLERQQEQVIDLLTTNDQEIERINRTIQADQALRSYDKLVKDQRKRETLIKRQITLENQLHSIERKITAAQYTITD